MKTLQLYPSGRTHAIIIDQFCGLLFIFTIFTLVSWLFLGYDVVLGFSRRWEF